MKDVINVIMCSHGEYAAGILSSLRLLVDKNISAEPVCAYCGEIKNSTDLSEALSRHVRNSRKEEKELIIFTDILGGSITNCATLLMMSNPDIHVVTGMSLPMLMEFYLSADKPLPERIRVSLRASQESGAYMNSFPEFQTTKPEKNSPEDDGFFD